MTWHPAFNPSRRWLLVAGVTGCLFLLANILDRNEPPAEDPYKCEKDGGKIPFTPFPFDPGTAQRPSKAPILRLVEFTDEGELVDRCQWSDVLYEVRGTPRVNSRTRDRMHMADRMRIADWMHMGDQMCTARKAKLVVVYVHGWKHNADSRDDDVTQFTKLVNEIGFLEVLHGRPRDVVGIYLAWPGKGLDIPVLDNLSFWGRKGGADRVIAAGNVSKLISSIKSVSCQDGNLDNFIVGIGHSFGGRILFGAVAPHLLDELATKHPGENFETYGQVTGNIDLTVLLNPAFEASRYTALNSSRRNKERIGPPQQPLLLTIATSNDAATRFAFPAGQVMGTRWRERERTTLGNYRDYGTHELGHSHGPRSKHNFWYDGFCNSGICLELKDGISGYPFLVANTDASVLDNHDGIWDDRFRSWLANFIEMTSKHRLERGCPLLQ